jgi:pyridoxal/pyridoxine/pyridoxamine kinase
MGAIVPVVLFLLLGLKDVSQFLTIAVSTLLAWGVGDLLSGILERPRLKGRSPSQALKHDWQNRSGE